MLRTLVALLVASVVFVPLSRRAVLGSVLGYLVAGATIGPAGLGLVTDVADIAGVSELGVVMLLFLIGLELRPRRLWVMRRAVFGLGLSQVLGTAALLAVLAHAVGVAWGGAVVLGTGFALSSTAIVLPMLAERDLLQGRAGRDAFAVLLLQDLAFIPLVALVPLLAAGAGTLLPALHGAGAPGLAVVPWARVAQAAAAITAILVGGRFLLPLVFRAVGGTRTPEVFTATALLVVVGTAFLAASAGLSMSLGAFLAGVLLSGSEYRHELQADIEPFEGLLLGFFFMSVGMAAQLGLLATHPAMIGLGVLGLLLAKAAVVFLLGRIGGQTRVEAARFALALPQGSEFSFVLFAAAVAVGALAPAQADGATLVIALSMAATPVLFSASERFLVPRLEPAREPEYDAIDAEAMPVIICGVGRVGQIVGRVLRMQGIGFVALEKDAAQIDVLRRFGSKVYYGDAARADLLRAAGAATARVLVIAIDDMEAALRVAEIARRQFPHLRVVARARNRRHAHLLMDRGVAGLVRETFHSSLRLTELTLDALGRDPAGGRDAVAVFAGHDEASLLASHAYYEDETQLIQNAQQQAAELTELFQADRPQP